MAASFSRTHATAVLLDDGPDILASATCPMCHTSATVSQSALDTMDIRPLHDRIIVRRHEEGEQISGGIIIPDNAKEKHNEAP